MLEPTGPLPPEIYWRRRLLAIGVIAVALALVLWVAFAVLRGGGDDKKADGAATTTSATHKPAGSSSGAPESSGANPSGTSVSAGAAPAGQTKQCPDQSLAVKVNPEQPTYKAGEQPVFGIVITNISSSTCERDMGSALQQVTVQSLDGQRRMWASTDCYPEGPSDLRTLTAGQQAFFRVTWTGTSSQPSCAGERVPVPAGAYVVTAQLGSVRSNPEPFNIA